MNRMLRRPGRDGFPARLIQDMAAAAGVALGHRAARPAAERGHDAAGYGGPAAPRSRPR
jgi:hypothetical protein